jgi:hypothetical protein
MNRRQQGKQRKGTWAFALSVFSVLSCSVSMGALDYERI